MDRLKYFWLELKIVRHEFFAALIVFLIGIYYGFFNTQSVSGYYQQYVDIMNGLNDSMTNPIDVLLFVIKDSLFSFIIFCMIMVAGGIVLGFVPILLLSIQGMYMGFGFKYMFESGEKESVLAWVLMLLNDLSQTFLMITAAALGIRLGRILFRFAAQVIRKKVITFRFELQIWWLLVRSYALALAVISLIVTAIKVAMIYL